MTPPRAVNPRGITANPGIAAQLGFDSPEQSASRSSSDSRCWTAWHGLL